MPNHCSNKLIVTGTDADVNAFRDALLKGGKEPEINNLIPMPDDVGNSDNWYSWAIENWGSKWGAYREYVVCDGDDRLEINYETAWCPLSVEFWEKVAWKFPKLTFVIVYYEIGMDFAGGHRVRAGRPTIEIEDGCLSDCFPDHDESASHDDLWEAQVNAVDNYINDLIKELTPQ